MERVGFQITKRILADSYAPPRSFIGYSEPVTIPTYTITTPVLRYADVATRRYSILDRAQTAIQAGDSISIGPIGQITDSTGIVVGTIQTASVGSAGDTVSTGQIGEIFGTVLYETTSI